MSRPRIGVDMLYYALLLSDTTSAASYDTPVRITNVTQIGLNFNSQFSTFFADDGPREAYSQVGEVDVTLSVADLTSEQYAELLGSTRDVGTGRVDNKSTDTPPEVAIGFRSLKSNGEYRYMWLMKGVFGVPDEDFQTKEGSINFQTQTITGKFMARTYDDMIFRRIDTDEGIVDPADWFADPDLSGLPAALTISGVVPANLGTDIAITSAVTWTFSAAVLAADANTTNFKLYNSTDAAWVAGSVAVGGGDTVVFTPTVDLTNAKLHVASVAAGVRGAAGGSLADPYVSTFTTIA